jgi:AcrR family transcriptional regulator
MAATIDRRVARTQAAMRRALISLLRRKDYADITVREILDEADIGRSTFYAHCSGKEQLLRLSFRLLRSELAAMKPSPDSDPAPLLPFALPVIRHLAEHRDLYGAFAGSGSSELIFSELRQLVVDLARRDLQRATGGGAVPVEVELQFVAGAFTALLGWWIDGKARLAPEALDAMFQRLVRDGITARERADP